MYQIIASGSTGNAIIYHKTILVDIGVPYSFLRPYIKQLQLILLTHSHKDHINIKTLTQIMTERPTMRIACGRWMEEFVSGFRNVDYCEIGQLYDYGSFSISPIKLYHDVENCGWRIFKDEFKILHATDSAHLDGITAKEYNLFALESNYCEDAVFETIREIESKGGYAHQRGSINSHLSDAQARDFFYKNKGANSQMIRLHESKHSY